MNVDGLVCTGVGTYGFGCWLVGLSVVSRRVSQGAKCTSGGRSGWAALFLSGFQTLLYLRHESKLLCMQIVKDLNENFEKICYTIRDRIIAMVFCSHVKRELCHISIILEESPMMFQNIIWFKKITEYFRINHGI